MGPYGPIWGHMGPYGAHMGPYGPIWALMGPYGAHMGPYGPIWALWYFNYSITGIDPDSASFLLEKLKNQVILTKNLDI